MRIEDNFGPTQGVYATSGKKDRNKDGYLLLPLFAGEDSVSISSAARERYAAQKATGEDTGQTAEEKASDETTASDGVAGGSSLGDGSAGEIGKLENQLRKLQAELMDVANDASLDPAEKEAKMGSIQAQIAQISAQIAELKSKSPKAA